MRWAAGRRVLTVVPLALLAQCAPQCAPTPAPAPTDVVTTTTTTLDPSPAPPAVTTTTAAPPATLPPRTSAWVAGEAYDWLINARGAPTSAEGRRAFDVVEPITMSPNFVSVSLGPRSRSDSLQLEIYAPYGRDLQVGRRYSDVRLSAPDPTTQATFKLIGNGRGCSSVADFVIDQLTWNTARQVTALAVRYDFTCIEDADDTWVPGGGYLPHTRGALAFNATVPTYDRTIDPGLFQTWAPLGAVSETRSVTVTNLGTAVLHPTAATITGRDASTFTITADRCANQPQTLGSSCTIDVVFTPGNAYGDRIAVLHHFDELSPDAAGTSLILSGVVNAPG